MLVENLAVNSEEDIIREPDTSLVQNVTYDIYDQSIKLSEEPYGAPQQRSLIWAPSHTRDRYQSPQSKEVYMDGARQQEALYLLANGQQHGAMMPLVRLDEMNPTTPLDRAEYYRSRYRSHTLTPVDASPATLQSRIDFAETVWQAYINGQIHSYRTSMFGDVYGYKCQRAPGIEGSISALMEELAAHLDMVFPDIDRRSPYIQCLVATYFSRANLIREILQQSEMIAQPCDMRWTDTGIAMGDEYGRSKKEWQRKVNSCIEWVEPEFRDRQSYHHDRLVDSCGLECPFQVKTSEKVVPHDSVLMTTDDVTEFVERVRTPDLEEIWRFCVNLRFACDQHRYPTVSNGFVNNPNYSFGRDGAYVKLLYNDVACYLRSIIDSPFRMTWIKMGVDEIRLMVEQITMWGQEVENLRLNTP